MSLFIVTEENDKSFGVGERKLILC